MIKKKMIVPKAYQIPNTNLANNLTAQDDIKIPDREKNIFVTQCVIIRNNDYLCSEKIKINNLSLT
ncbi:MAG: hypothetical protein KIG84_04985 [Bacteroidales bacterium]|nr:hypothetical protein [Bacteroidales bacterium]